MQKNQFKPNIGDTIVTAKGGSYVCVTMKDAGVGAGYEGYDFYGKNDGGFVCWMVNGNCYKEQADQCDIYDEYQVVKIIPKLTPQVGDTIVTKERGLFTCSEVSPNGSFKGTRNSGYNEWEASGESYEMKTYPEILEAYRAVQIIPKQVAEVESLKFRIRVLETENELLTRLLLKVGVL